MVTERDREVLGFFDSPVVSYSAGKDSTACLLWALETGLPVRVVWCDTGNELPESPEYLDYIEDRLGVEIERLARPGRQFVDFVRQRGMWPIPGRCIVSSSTKREAMAWYLNQTETSPKALLILGQRRSESAGRAVLPDFTPASRSGLPIYRPILDWSLDDVFKGLDDAGVDAHPAYAKGRKRVGCVAWCGGWRLEARGLCRCMTACVSGVRRPLARTTPLTARGSRRKRRRGMSDNDNGDRLYIYDLTDYVNQVREEREAEEQKSTTELRDEIERLRDRVAELEAASAWVPVADRLPETEQR